MTAANSALAGSCNAVTVTIQDELNNPIAQGSNVAVTLSGNGSGSFYTTSACSVVTSTVTVLSGNSSAQVWFASNVPGSFTLTSQAASLFDGTKAFTVNPNAPTKLVMTGSATTTTGTCTPYSVTLQDTLNNLSPAGVAKTLNFSGGLAGAFYSDSSCLLSASSLSLSSTQTTAQIYYKATAAQTPNLTVDDAGLPDLVSSVLPITVTSSGGSATLALKINGAAGITTNNCVPYAVMTTDSAGVSVNVSSNLSVTLGGGGTGTFYSDSGCSTSSSTVTINNGTSLSYIYYQTNSPQNLVFAATATGASAYTFPVAVSAATTSGPSRLTLAGNTSIHTAACIPYILSLADANGNSVNASSNVTVTLSGKGTGDFYTEDTCTASAAGSVTIASGTSYTGIYYKNASAQNVNFVAQSTGLSNGTISVAITNANLPASLALKISGSTSIATNTCVPYAVMTTDAGGVSTNVSSNTTVTMAGKGSGDFYSDSGCTTTSATTTSA